MMKQIFILFLIIVSCQILVIGQVSNSLSVERTKKFEKASKDELGNLGGLLDSADFYLKTNRDKAFDFLEDAYMLTLRKTHMADQYRVLIKLGEYYAYYQQHDLSALNYENALNVLNNKSLYFSVLNSACREYLAANMPNKSIGLMLHNLGTLRQNQQVLAFDFLGDAYSSVQKTDSAIFYLRKCEKLSAQLNLTEENLSAKLKLAKIIGQKDIKQQFDILNEANIQSKAANNPKMQIETESQLADYYKNTNNEAEEISSRNLIIEELKTKGESLKKENVNVDFKLLKEQFNLAEIYFQQANFEKSLLVLEAIFSSQFKENTKEILELKKNAAKLRSEAYLKIGNQPKALRSYEEYSLILNELYSKSEEETETNALLSTQLRDHQWRIDFLEKDKTIYDADIKMRLQETENQQQKLNFQKWFILLLVVILLLLLASLILFISKYRIQQKHNSYLALKALRTQMNPHFIFNALNSINNFIAKNDELNANKYLGRFSKLMRTILNISDEDFISLDQEIEILDLYLQLEHLRFHDKFDYAFDISPEIDTSKFRVPPMIIQPYIENAVWHGLRYLEADGFLLVKIETVDKLLKISIEDNGIGRQKSQELKTKNQQNNESKGIKNTKNRLEILGKIYKKEIKSQISDLYENGIGTRVEIWIPMLEN